MGEEGPTDQKELVPRIGTFLILLGIFFFILFLASDFANLTDFDWLFLGLIFVAIGFFFRRRATPPPPAGRFGMIRKLRENAKNRKEKGKKKK
jgi:UDP-N-acetylmuramyl pentapeptide phosphotransferase/UDP-N-acetylglucosamine-1-phosphate transferase